MKSNQLNFFFNSFIVLIFSSALLPLFCDAAIVSESTSEIGAYLNPAFLNFIVYFKFFLISHPVIFILAFFSLIKKKDVKVVEPKVKPQAIGGAILDGLRDIARWVGDKIKGLLGIGSRALKIVWVILKTVLKELARPILIIAALGCWVLCYSLAIYVYLIHSFGYFSFWDLGFDAFLALLVQAFGKAFKSILLLWLCRSTSLFLLFLVLILKKFG